jgi:DNA-binding transcriptional MerR regulator
MPDESEYSIGELATLAGVTPRTIRYYISIGLLPSPGQAGPQTRYGDGHLARLRLIRKLQREHLPLGEIAQRLDGLDDETVELALEASPAAAAPGSALDYIRQLQSKTAAPHLALRSFEGSEPTAGPASSEPAPRTSGPKVSAPDQTQRTQWERVPLSQNVELHVRRPLGRLEHKRVERLIRIGREILEEGDQS